MKLIMEQWRKYRALVEQEQNSFYKRDYDKSPLTDEELEILDQDDDEGVNARAEILAHMYDFNELPDFSPSVGGKSLGLSIHNKISDLAKEKGKEISALGQDRDRSQDGKKKKQGYQKFDSSSEYINPDSQFHGTHGREETDERLNQNCWINLLAHYTFNRVEEIPYCLLEIHNQSDSDISYGIIDSEGKRKKSSELFLEILNDLMSDSEAKEDENGEIVGLGDYNGSYGYRKRWERSEGGSSQYSDRYSFCPINNKIASSYNNFNLAAGGTRYILMPRNEEYKIVFYKKNRNRNSPGPLEVNLAPLIDIGPGHVATREFRGGSIPDARISTMTISVEADFGDKVPQSAAQRGLMAQDPRYGLRNGTDKYRHGQNRDEEPLNDHIGSKSFTEAKLKNLIRNIIGR